MTSTTRAMGRLAPMLTLMSKLPLGSIVRMDLPEHRQEVWESAPEDPGGWYSTSPTAPQRLTWHELFLRAGELGGHLVLLSACDEQTFDQGWQRGRFELLDKLQDWGSMQCELRGAYPGDVRGAAA